MTDTSAWYEIWVEHYDSYSRSESKLVCRVAHKELAEHLVERWAGWGEDYSIQGGPDPDEPTWASMTIEEFNAEHIAGSGRVVERSSRLGRHLVQEEKEAEERRRLYQEAMALKQIGSKGRN